MNNQSLEFKKLSNVEIVEEPSETANVLIEEDGVIKKAPKTAVGGAGGTSGHWIMYSNGTITASEGIYEALENLLENGVPVCVTTFYDSQSDSFHGFKLMVPDSIYWNTPLSSVGVNGVNGIIFFIKKDGNHSYYWD